MNDLPLHPAIVHVPLGGAVLVPLLAFGMAWAVWRGLLAKRAWFVVTALQSVVVVAAIMALRSGEQEEERVEELVSEAVLEDHEDLGKLFAWGAGGVLVLAASVLVVGSPRGGRFLMVAAGLASAALLALAIVVGHSGGKIVYGPRGLAASRGTAPGASDALEHDGAVREAGEAGQRPAGASGSTGRAPRDERGEGDDRDDRDERDED